MRRIGRYIAGRLLPKAPYPILRGPLRGHWFILGAAAGDGGGASIHLGCLEPEQTRCALEVLRPGDVFFDVGANVGYYSMLAAMAVGAAGRVVAFEPVPRNVSFLDAHLRLNRIENVTILPYACSDRSSLSTFNAGLNSAMGSLAGPWSEPTTFPSPKDSLVLATTLDDVAQALGIRPHVLKIDVEGAEAAVLRGAYRLLSESRAHVLLSVHSDALRSECLGWLSRLGYTIRPLDNPNEAVASEFLGIPSRSTTSSGPAGMGWS
jgi:FkbM family methyltransferase